MLTVSEINYLRNAPPGELVDDYADFCADRFSMDGVPIVIAAHKEERDLPATLLAAALSDIKVMAIVGENGSDDRTAEFAKKMGAVVRHSDTAAKVGALQLGTKFAVEELGSQDVLYTDADTLVGRKWARTLRGELASSDDQPVILSGPAVFTHGNSSLVDGVRSAKVFTVGALRAAKRLPLQVKGANMALHFDERQELYDTYQRIRPNLFIGEERAMRDIVVALGGAARHTLSLSATVVARGDRLGSFSDCFRLLKDREYRASLYDDYASTGPFVRYNGSNAFYPDVDSSSTGASG